MPELRVKWPEDDLRAIDRAIKRSVNKGRRDIRHAVIQAGVYLARSASAATEKAKPTRKTIKNDDSNSRWPARRYPYYREIWQDGPDDVYRWYLKERSDTTNKKIKRAGLAKKSWYWMIPGIRRRNAGNFAQEVDHRQTALDYEIEMSNKLPYIRDALKVNDDGSRLLNDALGKAARQLERDTDRRMRRMMR